MIAASPNWRSRSSTSVRRPSYFARAGERCSRVRGLHACADELELRMLRERLAELVKTLARAGREDPDAWSFLRLCGGHRVTPSVRALSMLRGESVESAGGRSSSESLPFCSAQYSFCDCASVTRSWIEKS